MILGMTLYTFVHVLISLIGIAAGLVVLWGMLTSNRMDTWTAVFLIFTGLTSLTGFGFPFHGVTPAIVVGIISMIVLIVAILARYTFRLSGAWRWIFVGTAILAEYLNAFVLVVQAYLKIPALHALAPTGTEPAFQITQGAVLVFFVVTGIWAVRRFHPAP